MDPWTLVEHKRHAWWNSLDQQRIQFYVVRILAGLRKFLAFSVTELSSRARTTHKPCHLLQKTPEKNCISNWRSHGHRLFPQMLIKTQSNAKKHCGSSTPGTVKDNSVGPMLTGSTPHFMVVILREDLSTDEWHL